MKHTVESIKVVEQGWSETTVRHEEDTRADEKKKNRNNQNYTKDKGLKTEPLKELIKVYNVDGTLNK